MPNPQKNMAGLTGFRGGTGKGKAADVGRYEDNGSATRHDETNTEGEQMHTSLKPPVVWCAEDELNNKPSTICMQTAFTACLS